MKINRTIVQLHFYPNKIQYEFYQKYFHILNNCKTKKYKIHYFIKFDNSSVKIRLLKFQIKRK